MQANWCQLSTLLKASDRPAKKGKIPDLTVATVLHISAKRETASFRGTHARPQQARYLLPSIEFSAHLH